MTETPIQRAAQYAGGQSALARKLGLTPQAVQKWCQKGRVPSEMVLHVESAVEARVTRYELRPDLYPSTVRVA